MQRLNPSAVKVSSPSQILTHHKEKPSSSACTRSVHVSSDALLQMWAGSPLFCLDQGSLESGTLAGQTSTQAHRQRKSRMSQTSGRWSWRVIWLDTRGQSRCSVMSKQTTSTCCHDGIFNAVFCCFFLFFPDVCELWGERSGHMLHRPPADCVEERRTAVPPTQPGTLPKTGREWRTLTSFILKMDRSQAVSSLWWLLSALNDNVMIVACLFTKAVFVLSKIFHLRNKKCAYFISSLEHDADRHPVWDTGLAVVWLAAAATAPASILIWAPLPIWCTSRFVTVEIWMFFFFF